MTSVSAARMKRRSLARKASSVLQRWPSRNHFAEMAPLSSDKLHPIDALLEREPHLRKVARRTARLLAKLQEQANPANLLEFEAERTLLDTARVEVAFNLGFENGLVLGRAEGLRQTTRRSRDGKEKALLADLRAALAATRASPHRASLLLQELALALASGP
jgi:flagellar biosynthesis/type III secretory pathway protein FliH